MTFDLLTLGPLGHYVTRVKIFYSILLKIKSHEHLQSVRILFCRTVTITQQQTLVYTVNQLVSRTLTADAYANFSNDAGKFFNIE